MEARKYRYFLYSKAQHNLRTEIDKKIKKVFTPGKVLTKGRWVQYTEISTKPENLYADTRVVAQGYLEDMKYQMPTSIWGAQ